MIRLQFPYAAAITVIAGLAAAGFRDETLTRFEFRAAHMGTQFRIVLYTVDERSANAASQAAFHRIAQLNDTLSDYNYDSELMQLCSKAGGQPSRVSNDLFFVLTQAQRLATDTDGAFDVTVGPVVRLWRQARRQKKLPDSDRLARARMLVGHENIRLDANQQTVQLLKQGMQLDLGGIAKGYAADQALDELKRRGVPRALVAAAGDVVVSAPPPGETGWTIAVTSPSGVDNPPIDYLLLHDAAVSTSGDLEQFVELDGKRYSHIIDPKTGWALTNRLQVTVVAPNGTLADSLATAVSVMEPELGINLVEATPDTGAMITKADDAGRTRITSSRYDKLPRRIDGPARSGRGH